MSVFRTLVENQYCDKCKTVKRLSESNAQLNARNQALSGDLQMYKDLRNFCKYNESILKIDVHNETVVMVTVQNEYDYKGNISCINLYAYAYSNSCKFTKVQTLWTRLIYQDHLPKYINITDFKGVENRGYGSIVMSQFLSYIKTLGLTSIDEVTGFLSFVDHDHWDMLYHFYEKFGFEITENKHLILSLHSNK